MSNYNSKQEISQGQNRYLYILSRNYLIVKQGYFTNNSILESETNQLINDLLSWYNQTFKTNFRFSFNIDKKCFNFLISQIKQKTKLIRF